MNRWDQLKREILDRFPEWTRDGWLTALGIWLCGWESEFTISEEVDGVTYNQTAILRRYKGKEYFWKFGSLE